MHNSTSSKSDIHVECEVIVDILDSLKFSDIKIIDVEDRSPIAYYFIIATARSLQHLKISSSQVVVKLRSILRLTSISVNGDKNDTGWIAIDIGNIIIHLFEESVRGRYAIEDLLYSE